VYVTFVKALERLVGIASTQEGRSRLPHGHGLEL
jgi:hypothetical protein